MVGMELDVGFVQCCAWGDCHNLYLVTWEVVKPVATVRRLAQSEAKKKKKNPFFFLPLFYEITNLFQQHDRNALI